MNSTLQSQLEKLREASYQLQISSTEQRNQALELIKQTLLDNIPTILEANQKDLAKMEESDPLYDRMLLSEDRVKDICAELETVISLDDPLNHILEEYDGPAGIHLQKTTVPLGCIGIIYEARPNVTVDVTSLCLKSGNAALLRGSSSAYESNQVLVGLIQDALSQSEIPADAVQLLDPDRELATEMMQANDYLDLIIPRGGKNLIQHVRDTASVPTIETGASVVHTYVDESAKVEMACNIVYNEKIRRPSVCNAVDTILVNKKIAQEFLQQLAEKLQGSNIVVHTDQGSQELLEGKYDQLVNDADQHFDHEFLSLEMNVVLVNDIDQAIAHIRQYSLKHSESIVTEDQANAAKFQREVDAACVYVNTSTCFSDGAQFGLGAEIGISTQKLHARGPMALRELTSYKWLITSDGITRD